VQPPLGAGSPGAILDRDPPFGGERDAGQAVDAALDARVGGGDPNACAALAVGQSDNGKGKPVWWRYCHSQQNASAKTRDANPKSLCHFENAAKKRRDL